MKMNDVLVWTIIFSVVIEVGWTPELCYCFVSLNTVVVQSPSQCSDAAAGKYLTVCVLILDQSLVTYDFGVKRK